MPSDVAARRLHPITPFFNLIVGLRNFALPLLLALFAGGDRGRLFYLVPLALVTLPNVVAWWRFTYRIDGGSLVIDEGLLTRKTRVLPLDRIQQVDVTSRLRDRLFRVTALRIDTAGGASGAEVTLSVVDLGEADRLRATLLRRGQRPEVAQGDPEEVRPLVQLGPGRLALAGVTGSEMAVMISILFWVSQFVDDLPDSLLEDMATRVTAPTTVPGFVLAAAVTLSLWLALAALASIVKHAGFTIVAHEDELRVRRGLLERREISLPLHRLQAVRVQRTLVRRWLGFSAVRLQSGGRSGSERSGVSRIDVPLLRDGDVQPFLHAIVHGVPPTELTPAPPVARRRAIVRRVLPVAVAGVPAAVVWPLATPLVAAAIAVAVVAGELAYRGLGHASAGGFVVARSGGLARETVIVPMAKTQSTRVSTSPFQRRAGLATLRIDVAGRGRTPSVKDAAVADAEAVRRSVFSQPAHEDEASTRRRRPSEPDQGAE